jgi:hypothetical protein
MHNIQHHIPIIGMPPGGLNLPHGISLQQIFEMLFPQDHDNGRKIRITREDLEKQPMAVLDHLMEQFNEDFCSGTTVDKLGIKFLEEQEDNDGMFGKQFISELFSGISKKMAFKVCPNGLFKPELAPGKLFTDEDQKVYFYLGRLMMFCVNAKDDYLIGKIFDERVYTAIIQFPEGLLNKNIIEAVQDETNFEEFFSLYQLINSYDAASSASVARMAQYIQPWNQVAPPGVIQVAYELVESDLPKELQGLQCRDEMMAHAGTIQRQLKKVYMEQHFFPELAPLHALARGMREAEFQTPHSFIELQCKGPHNLLEQLQGRLNAEAILGQMVFKGVPPAKEKWMRDWLGGCNEKMLEQFLFAMTGGKALGRRELTVINATSKTRTEFHNCFHLVMFNFDKVQNPVEFKLAIEVAIHE